MKRVHRRRHVATRPHPTHHMTVRPEAQREKSCNDQPMTDELDSNRSRRERVWAELFRRANRGDQDAYAKFLTEVAPVLRGIIAARNAGQSNETEDIVQNTLIAIHEKRHTWRESDPVTAWVYAIARYKATDAWRKYGRHRTVTFDGEEQQIKDETVTDPTIPRDLNTLLGRLDGTSASIVRAVKLDGASAEETGARHGMSAGAVRVALHRAMTRLTGFALDDDARNSADQDGKP